MNTFIALLGWTVFGIGALAILAGIYLLIHIIFVSRSNAQSQCPYCTKVWRDETIWLEFWHDRVSFPLHIRNTPFHKERQRWFKQDKSQFGLHYALDMQRSRIKQGIEPPLASAVPAYWDEDDE